MFRIILACALSLTAALSAAAQDAPTDLQDAVKAACTALAPAGGETMIEVNPEGSQSYGVALIVHTINDEAADRYVCIYDKAEAKAELSTPFTPPGEAEASDARLVE